MMPAHRRQMPTTGARISAGPRLLVEPTDDLIRQLMAAQVSRMVDLRWCVSMLTQSGVPGRQEHLQQTRHELADAKNEIVLLTSIRAEEKRISSDVQSQLQVARQELAHGEGHLGVLCALNVYLAVGRGRNAETS